MMEIEFGIRFNRLFRGPGWSGNNEERGYPYEVWGDLFVINGGIPALKVTYIDLSIYFPKLD